ncbi:hypothetical protein CONCODRAFT_77100 [Conidiobolus coronatus NRRL 28638]|uniref:Uncharacterized protein n=1 Tax=Conidiobolus coronatus (strain ATCC 28846 / CBS 209.66 / NRRL 28638) TaxID=796925 RepID=A0A137PG28_CONC2|nr:hypothetical protein CONCODRAFT_77100 [Conidiobolus coronatus NRRL 28638]|eukprot:KXN73957.1 hypothetical protein CONCODRAFT_77100 [Conidiobolus coronatus NRRL 28638]
MFDHFYLADQEKARSSANNSAFNTPNGSRLASPAVSRRPSMDFAISKEVKVKTVKPTIMKLNI